jgi:hypothetical protein
MIHQIKVFEKLKFNTPDSQDGGASYVLVAQCKMCHLVAVTRIMSKTKMSKAEYGEYYRQAESRLRGMLREQPCRPV